MNLPDIPGLDSRRMITSRAFVVTRGGYTLRVPLIRLLGMGEKWVIRKMIRFRRYAKRMERV